MKILIVDDEPKIVELVQLYLEKDSYRVVSALDGKTGLELARRERPDLIILDLNLPGMDGLEVCRALRKESNVPIIMLTARDEDVDKIIGLELGADDYITKPFSPREVVARVKAVFRRTIAEPQARQELRASDLLIDLVRHEVRRQDRLIELTPTEFKLLEAMAQEPGRVFTRLQLLDKVQGYTYEGYERTIDAHIKNLRQKIEPDAQKPRYILTVYGFGYKFQDNVDK